ncbi:hypothetical protein WJX73_007313 [Symbiochloris irregularis]|uniref:Beta-amylase n=1 Tax=Symbiochloris irregularis TaxID=706552 RepID=A0AAW1NZA1_9CHLO
MILAQSSPAVAPPNKIATCNEPGRHLHSNIVPLPSTPGHLGIRQRQNKATKPAPASDTRHQRPAPLQSTGHPSLLLSGLTSAQPDVWQSLGSGQGLFVMLPLDSVNHEGVFRYAASRWFLQALEHLVESGVCGVAVDVWWGAVERQAQKYDWSGYRQLFEVVKNFGLSIQVVLSFHSCGGNVGDSAQIPLPKWVLKAGDVDPDLFFTDRPRDARLGRRNREVISIFADHAPRALQGRSPMECYADFMRNFRDAFLDDIGTSITEIVIGSGPCGELRYPAYVEANGWRFPGVGEFQCYDRRAMASLAAAAHSFGHPEWGYSGPHDAGSYSSNPEDTGFFCRWNGQWETPYGRFFLRWYSDALVSHARALLQAATTIFNPRGNPHCNVDNHNDPFTSSVHAQYGSAANLASARTSAAEIESEVVTPTSSDPGRQSFISEEDLSVATAAGASSPARAQAPSPPSAASDAPDLEEAPQPSHQPNSDVNNRCPGGSGTVSPVANGGGRGKRAPPKSMSLSAFEATAGSGASTPAALSTRSEDGERRVLRPRDRPAGHAVELVMKLAGVHWWWGAHSHAAELTAGYFNVGGRDGYNAIVEAAAEAGAALTLTCVEMCDSQHPPEALCSPEGLLRQVREAAARAGVHLGGENALPCFSPHHIDSTALERIVYNTRAWGPPLQEESARREALYGTSSAPDLTADHAQRLGLRTHPWKGPGSKHGEELPHAELPAMRGFTFLRLTPEMLNPAYLASWRSFMHAMRSNAHPRILPGVGPPSSAQLGSAAGKQGKATWSRSGSGLTSFDPEAYMQRASST